MAPPLEDGRAEGRAVEQPVVETAGSAGIAGGGQQHERGGRQHRQDGAGNAEQNEEGAQDGEQQAHGRRVVPLHFGAVVDFPVAHRSGAIVRAGRRLPGFPETLRFLRFSFILRGLT
jgi:hypothetical protein